MPILKEIMKVVTLQYSQSKTGQYMVTIPKDIVEKMGLKKGDKLTVLDAGDHIKLIPSKKVVELLEVL
jgi:AbrB family looped-hinge helix DNA binding protein